MFETLCFPVISSASQLTSVWFSVCPRELTSLPWQVLLHAFFSSNLLFQVETLFSRRIPMAKRNCLWHSDLEKVLHFVTYSNIIKTPFFLSNFLLEPLSISNYEKLGFVNFPVVRGLRLRLPVRGVLVPSLAKELRSHVPCDQNKNANRIAIRVVNHLKRKEES